MDKLVKRILAEETEKFLEAGRTEIFRRTLARVQSIKETQQQQGENGNAGSGTGSGSEDVGKT